MDDQDTIDESAVSESATPLPQDSPQDSTSRFFFNLKNFDEEYVEEVEDEEPPEPTFSEAELTLARKEGFQKGKEEGKAEAEASREKQIAGILGAIKDTVVNLIAEEQNRNELFETEAVLLSKAIFEKLFPTLNASQGLNEVETIIKTVLSDRRTNPEIIIEVPTEYAESVQQRLDEGFNNDMTDGKCIVKGVDNMDTGACRLSWDNGGAQRDISALTEEIHRQLEEALADRPKLDDNKEDEEAHSDLENNPSADMVNEETDDE